MKIPSRFVEEFLQDGEEFSAKEAVALARQRLSNDVTESLRATGYFATVSCEINVRVERGGHVSLWGVVPTYYLKQKAQAAAMSVDGVDSVRNDVVVMR